jgi:hypothetical protein
MGELAAGRKEIKVCCTAAFRKAAIAPPDDTEGQCRTQREFPAVAFERHGFVE